MDLQAISNNRSHSYSVILRRTFRSVSKDRPHIQAQAADPSRRAIALLRMTLVGAEKLHPFDWKPGACEDRS